MAGIVKRPSLDEDWAARAWCKYKDPDYWDLDTPLWLLGRINCVLDCPVREACLRDALRNDATGVVRGGIPFDEDQVRHKNRKCLFCRYPTAPIDDDGIKGLCWICREYASCAMGCGRMVVRRPNMDSYPCDYCTGQKGGSVATTQEGRSSEVDAT